MGGLADFGGDFGLEVSFASVFFGGLPLLSVGLVLGWFFVSAVKFCFGCVLFRLCSSV